MDLEIIAALDGKQSASKADIAEALRYPCKLQHGGEFTGKPGTQVYASENWVIKLHPKLQFSPKDQERWIQRQMDKERELNVYHPSRCWFIVEKAGNHSVIGNATRRLQGLHCIHPSQPNEGLRWLEALIRLYFRVVKRDIRLDEGLSNFGLDETRQLYYMDDDLYAWDEGQGFAQMLALWLRQLDWLNEDSVEQLAHIIRNQVIQTFQDPIKLDLFANLLDGVSLIQPQAQKKQQLLYRILSERKRPQNKHQASRIDAATEKLPRRFALLADIHANAAALHSVLNNLKERGLQDILILGDLIGYGPDPVECIQMVQQCSARLVRGNHDHAVAFAQFERGLSATARWAAEWTREQLDDETRAWLGELPLKIVQDEWIAVHGAPVDPNCCYGYVYQMTYQSNLEWLEKNGIAIGFHGHSHIQGVFSMAGFDSSAQQTLKPKNSYLVCPGSVGQPRNGRPGAEFAIADLDSGTLEFCHLEYDLTKTAVRMQELGFPSQLSDRLRKGT